MIKIFQRIWFNLTRLVNSYKLWRECKKRGFNDLDLYDLDMEIAKFILPRLCRFKEICDSTPSNLEMTEWDIILDKMIYAFSVISFGDTLKNEQVEGGLDLFRKYYRDLWI